VRTMLREWRQRRGLTQQQLAERAGITRQTIGGLEAGQYGPGVDVALHLAHALGCSVEDLFALSDAPEFAAPLLGDAGSDGRVAIAELEGRTVARSLKGLGQSAAAHGIAASTVGNGMARIHRFEGTRPGLFLAGCDPALGLLCGHIDRSPSGLEARWWNAGNGEALSQLQHKEVHASALHRSGEAAAGLPGVVRFRLASWQMGFITERGNPKQIASADDLLRPGVRLINRERGAGARDLLDRLIAAAGIAVAAIPGYGRELLGHREIAQAVAFGSADVGIGHAGVAAEYGLGFVPVADEACDLLLFEESLTGREAQVLLDALRSGAFRRDLAAFGPYDTHKTGDRIA
jgi:putative molybdopterin biosynthesis protein